jgi:hypothetical protein
MARRFSDATKIVELAYREVGGQGKFWRRWASCQYNRKRIQVLAAREIHRKKTAGLKACLYRCFQSRSEKGLHDHWNGD